MTDASFVPSAPYAQANGDHATSGFWDNLEGITPEEVAAEELPPEEFLNAGMGAPEEAAQEQSYDVPDPNFVKTPRRKNGAPAYEKKVAGLLNVPLRFAATNPATVPDAAALAMYGPRIAHAWGDAAANDERIARAIDFLTTGTENPLAAAITATAPLVLQIIRNHEPQLETKQRGIRIPFTKGKRTFSLRFGVKLGRIRPLTHDPDAFTDYVFGNPAMQAALRKNGIDVAGFIRSE